MPVVGSIRGCKRAWRSGDLGAALVVWAILVPESMAYASIAGMPPQTGLYVATIPLLAYALFGTSRRLTVGRARRLLRCRLRRVTGAGAGAGDRARCSEQGPHRQAWSSTRTASALMATSARANRGVLPVRRFYTHETNGNRLEFLQPRTDEDTRWSGAIRPRSTCVTSPPVDAPRCGVDSDTRPLWVRSMSGFEPSTTLRSEEHPLTADSNSQDHTPCEWSATRNPTGIAAQCRNETSDSRNLDGQVGSGRPV